MKRIPTFVIFLSIFMAIYSGYVFARSTERGFTLIRIDILTEALCKFRRDVGHFPTKQEGLQALIKEPQKVRGWKGPYLDRVKIPLDAWDQKFIYSYPPKFGKKEFNLYSVGRNGIDNHGEGDDILND